MKSIEELMAIRDKTRKNMTVREDTGDSKIRVVVGMATCGIAAGARPVLNAFVDEKKRRKGRFRAADRLYRNVSVRADS